VRLLIGNSVTRVTHICGDESVLFRIQIVMEICGLDEQVEFCVPHMCGNKSFTIKNWHAVMFMLVLPTCVGMNRYKNIYKFTSFGVTHSVGMNHIFTKYDLVIITVTHNVWD